MSTHNICFCGEIGKYLPDTYSYLDYEVVLLTCSHFNHFKADAFAKQCKSR